MELDMDVHHHEADLPVAALSSMADSLPGLGIVAAVLGVVITMGALGGPPEEIGHKVAAALVGTFLGILLCYGLFGPWPPAWRRARMTNTHYYTSARLDDAFMKGGAPIHGGRNGTARDPRPCPADIPGTGRNCQERGPAQAAAA